MKTSRRQSEKVECLLYMAQIYKKIWSTVIRNNKSLASARMADRSIGRGYCHRPDVHPSVCLSVCDNRGLWRNDSKDRADFWHRPSSPKCYHALGGPPLHFGEGKIRTPKFKTPYPHTPEKNRGGGPSSNT